MNHLGERAQRVSLRDLPLSRDERRTAFKLTPPGAHMDQLVFAVQAAVSAAAGLRDKAQRLREQNIDASSPVTPIPSSETQK